MNESYFSLCGVTLRVRAQQPISGDARGRLFACAPAEPALNLIMESVPEVNVPDAAPLRTDDETLVWRQGDRVISAKRTSQSAPPYAAVSYDLGYPEQAHLAVRADAMAWAAQPPQLWSSMALHQLLAPFGALIMHASLVRIGGRAVLFTAPCGTGKSTQARLWAELRGAEVLNGDKAGLRFMGGELIAFGVPICGTSGICKNMALPVAAIVELSQAKATAIRRLAPSAAVQAVSANIYAERCVPWQNALETVLQIVGSVPVLHLACTPDESAIAALEQVLGEETK